MSADTAPALPNRAERRRHEREQRKLQSALLTAVTRRDLVGILTPISEAAQQHELILSFLLERGLKIENGRAVLDADEFQAYLKEKNTPAEARDEKGAGEETVGLVSCDAIHSDEHDLMRFDTESPAHA